MPTRADMEYAVPLCTARVIERKSPRHGVHLTCFKPMRYDAPTNTWVCECGSVDAGALVAARRWLAAA